MPTDIAAYDKPFDCLLNSSVLTANEFACIRVFEQPPGAPTSYLEPITDLKYLNLRVRTTTWWKVKVKCEVVLLPWPKGDSSCNAGTLAIHSVKIGDAAAFASVVRTTLTVINQNPAFPEQNPEQQIGGDKLKREKDRILVED